jgi:chemotaxis protein CheC
MIFGLLSTRLFKFLYSRIYVGMKDFISQITADHKDAITEIINIGFGRAAASLSVLIGSHIILHVPNLEIYALTDLVDILEDAIPREAVIIHQVFSGQISGDVLLFMDIESASVLVDLLSGGNGVAKRISPSDREALIEVGNILMNGYIGSFGNLLHLKLSFDLPHLREESLARWLDSTRASLSEDRQYVVLVKTEFIVANVQAGGYVALLLDLESLRTLVFIVDSGSIA